MLKNYLSDYAKKGFKHYTELRAQENRTRAVAMLDGTLVSNVVTTQGGINARVCVGGAYGVASSSEYTPDTVGETAAAALDNAEFLDGKQKLGKSDFAPTESASFDCGLDHDPVTQKELIEFTSEVDAHIAKKYPDLASKRVVTQSFGMEKLLLTSDNVMCRSLKPRSLFAYALTRIDGDGAPVTLSEVHGGHGFFKELFTDPESLYEKIDKLYGQLRDKCEAVHANAGLRTVVIAPELAGILAHEAVGHTVEADFVIAGSVAGPYLNKRVGSDLVTLVDFANTYNGQVLPMPVYYDDEGTKAVDAVIIENGILKGYMHNKESAREFGVAPTGNARAYTFSDESIIRMRNTAILPGRSKTEDMIASIDDGYYLVKTGNGQADTTGEFMFGVTLGYEIKNGKIGRAIKDTTLSGIAFELLQTVDMISDDMEWLAAGMCGKKQLIPVGMGGPSIKCKATLGGK